MVTDIYLEQVIKVGKEIHMRSMKRKLYTNNGHSKTTWSHIVFEHPATFGSLAMEAEKMQEIMDDLLFFDGFKVLAKNYLSLDTHPLFESIEILMTETKIIPADVAENLMPNSLKEDAEKCLLKLVEALK
ncbi:hypothetical protein RDI58_018083 [Solanum bulbocastanum]|uniref:AAA+ ATPase At3g28540-like C-terminal domain-containing protein n=1 Tax=Solanum bulbocastanum TaxID=147425 RepID=A0AAN8THA8_SOLBU